jgi:hypothetical protein
LTKSRHEVEKLQQDIDERDETISAKELILDELEAKVGWLYIQKDMDLDNFLIAAGNITNSNTILTIITTTINRLSHWRNRMLS